MTTLSERIEKILKDLPNMGQNGLAIAAGASKSVVNQWLDGKIKSMRLDYALNIEKSLGYDHIWLVLGDGHEKKASQGWPFSISFEQYQTIPDEGKKDINQHIEYTAHKWHAEIQAKSKKAG